MDEPQEFAMIYALAPGEDWGCDWVKIGAHQSSSRDVAEQELRQRYATVYPGLRILQLCFVATSKFRAERAVKEELQEHKHAGEVYNGLAGGLSTVLENIYAGLAVDIDSAYVEKLKPAKRALLRANHDKAQIKRLREMAAEEVASRRLREEIRHQEVMQTLEAEEQALERTRATELTVKHQRLEERKAARLRTPDDHAHAVSAWVERHIQITPGALVTLKRAFDVYKQTSNAVTLGKVQFSVQLKGIMASRGMPFIEQSSRRGVHCERFWDNVRLM